MHIEHILVPYLSENIVPLHQFLERVSCDRQVQARVL